MTSLANIFEIKSSEREREERVQVSSHRVHIRLLLDEGRWRGTAEQDANHNGPRMANRTRERFTDFSFSQCCEIAKISRFKRLLSARAHSN